MKLEVIAALRDKESKPAELFRALFDFYRKHPNASASQSRYFNATGFDKVSLKTLEYEVKQVFGIREAELHDRRINTAEKKETKTTDGGMTPATMKKLNDLDFDKANYHKDILPLATDISTELEEELESRKSADLILYLNSKKESLNLEPSQTELLEVIGKGFAEAPDEVKESVKLRDEFPFLGDPNTPDKFKILVADKYTAYDKYVASRKEIKELLEAGGNNTEIFYVAKAAVENFELNLDIYDELNHYKEHGEILGKHPIFKDEMLEASVKVIKPIDLVKRQKNLRTYISRDEKALKKMPEGDAKYSFADKIDDWKKELVLVDKRIESAK